MRKQIKKMIQLFPSKNIQFVLSICFTAVAIAGVFFIGSSLFLRFASANEIALEENNKRIVDHVNLSLDGYLRNMMKVSDAMRYRVINNCDLEKSRFTQDMNLLYEANRDVLVSIAAFDNQGNLVDATPLDKLKKTAYPQNESWFLNATWKIENIHFSTPHVQNLFDDTDYKYRWVVSVSRAIELTYGGETMGGVLLVDMNFSGIEQILKNVTLGKTGYIYLISNEGEIIYHPRQQLIYSDLEQENNMVAATYEDGTHKELFLGKQRLVTVKTMGYTGWKLIGITPVSDVYSSFLQIRVFAVFILLFTILLLIFANRIVSAKIANPIMDLENAVKKLERGEEDVQFAIGGAYEIRHLGETIQNMVAQMRRLMDDIVVEQESKRKSEFDALQSQINPHFLYNTLDSIVWMVENRRYQEAILMVTSLARFFRIGLSKGQTIITLSDELRHGENYITIQQMRYKDKFSFQIHAQEEALGLSTIKLMIQPLLENAVYHGMEFMDGDGEISVYAYLDGEELYIVIKDNGMGIPEEEIPKLLQRESSCRGKGSGIGLRNVHERIQLYFGAEYGLFIESEADVGTTIRIKLPQIPYGSNQEREDSHEMEK